MLTMKAKVCHKQHRFRAAALPLLWCSEKAPENRWFNARLTFPNNSVMRKSTLFCRFRTFPDLTHANLIS